MNVRDIHLCLPLHLIFFLSCVTSYIGNSENPRITDKICLSLVIRYNGFQLYHLEKSSIRTFKNPQSYLETLYQNDIHFVFYKNPVNKNIKASKCPKIKNGVVISLVAISISFEGFEKKMTFLYKKNV